MMTLTTRKVALSLAVVVGVSLLGAFDDSYKVNLLRLGLSLWCCALLGVWLVLATLHVGTLWISFPVSFFQTAGAH